MLGFVTNRSWQSETYHLARNALPIAFFYIVEMAMGFIDTAVAGRLSTVDLGAVGLASGLMFAFLYAAFGMTSTTAIFSADGQGPTQADRVTSSYVAGLIVTGALSPLIILAALSVPLFLRFTGQDEAVVASASLYIQGVVASVPLALIFNVYRALLSALGSGVIIVWASVIGIIANLVASPVLAFGVGFVPALGVFGIGLGTTIAHAAMVLFTLVATWKRHRISPLAIQRIHFDASLIREFIAIGWPGIVLGFLESGFFAAMQVIAGMYGVASLSATTIGVQLADIISVLGLSIGEATMISVVVITSKTYNPRAVNNIVITGALIAVLLMIAAGLGVTFNPRMVEVVFLGESESGDIVFQNQLQIVLAILPLALAADATQLVLVRALKALRDTRGPMFIAALGYWVVGIGGGYLLANVGQLGLAGVWAGFAIGLTCVSTVLALRLIVRAKFLPHSK